MLKLSDQIRARTNSAIILLGSNIEPIKNIPFALEMIKARVTVILTSSIWESKAVGSDGPNFLNVAVLVHTTKDPENLKWNVLRSIEKELGRTRGIDKNAPRTIDLDIILFNEVLLDEDLWKFGHIALPVAELLPDLVHPTQKISIDSWTKQQFDQFGCKKRNDLIIN